MAEATDAIPLRYDVFISYARPDQRWARRLDDDLTALGFAVFRDESRLEPGVEFAPALRAGLLASRHFIVVWSNFARESAFVREELARFTVVAEGRSDRRLIQLNLEGQNPAYARFYAIDSLLHAAVYPGDPAQVPLELWQSVVATLVSVLRSEPPASTPGNRVESYDFAVVIGISRYRGLPDAPDAAVSARAVAAWLTDEAGGGLPQVNVSLLVSDDDPEGFGPTRADVDHAFASLGSRPRRPDGGLGRRLYLYVSGQSVGGAPDDPALIVTEGTSTASLSPRFYAKALEEARIFEEVVLFVACGLIGLDGVAPPPRPALVLTPGPRSAPQSSFFYSFGAFGLTGPLLEGLSGHGAGPDGVMTSETLASYLIARSAQSGAPRPWFVSGGPRPIVFGRPSTSPRRPPSRAEEERVTAHADDPALVDELGRRPFAKVLAARIEEVWHANRSKGSAGEGAFMVNLHGPWGSGKTSILNFLRENLSDPTRPEDSRWVVVEFNAWRHQRLQPPWWSLIREIQTQAATQIDLVRAQLLRSRWLWGRVRADWLPVAVAAALIALAALLPVAIDRFFPPPATTKPPEAHAMARAIELGLKILTAVLPIAAAIFTLSRSLAFGSARAAQAYMEARTDPLRPIVGQFKALVKSLRQPLIVFVDDLDRCDVAYVIALLEGIQTLFRAAPVTYVVAADRKWICSCFEKTYADFAPTIGEPGRPLGYLFLDKVFQVSTSIPRLSGEMQRRYWLALLGAGASIAPEDVERVQQQAEQAAMAAVQGLHTQEQLEVKIAEASADPVKEQAMRAAAARQITSPAAQEHTGHRLRPFAGLLEPNPRSMKRLVNAYGFYQATHFLEGRRVSPEALARWTIVELRWPLLADFLAAQPGRVVDLANGVLPDDASVPRQLRALFRSETVKAVLVDAETGRLGLDAAAIQSVVGLAEAAPAAPALGQPRVVA